LTFLGFCLAFLRFCLAFLTFLTFLGFFDIFDQHKNKSTSTIRDSVASKFVQEITFEVLMPWMSGLEVETVLELIDPLVQNALPINKYVALIASEIRKLKPRDDLYFRIAIHLIKNRYRNIEIAEHSSFFQLLNLNIIRRSCEFGLLLKLVGDL